MKKILMILWFHFLCVGFIYSQDSSEKKHHLLIKAGGSFPTVETFLDEEGLVDPLEALTLTLTTRVILLISTFPFFLD